MKNSVWNILQSKRNKVSYFTSLSKTLPSLPIPSLQQLFTNYEYSIKPFTNSDNSTTSTPSSTNSLDIPIIHTLHQRLLNSIPQSTPSNWLDPLWNTHAYLKWRSPILIHSNWWCQFNDHPAHSKRLLIHPPPPGTLSDFQITRASSLLYHLLQFKSLLDNNSLSDYASKTNQTPLCMEQYKHQFGSTRIPSHPHDKLSHQHPCTSDFIILSTRNQLYKIQVIDGNNNIASIDQIKNSIYEASKNSLDTAKEAPIGLLTAGDRDNWFEAYTKLQQLDSQNTKNLTDIQDSLLVLCLDDYSVSANLDVSHHQMFHGINARNRWFDKTLQLIVASNGRAGVNGEHTPADAVIPGRMMDFILKAEKRDVIKANNKLSEPASTPANISKPPQKLKWTIDKSIEELILNAEYTAKKLIADHQGCLLQTDLYGSRYIKEVVKASPDSFIQMALQITWARLSNNEPTAIYETASTRAFYLGRTETCRSLTPESWNFCSNFDNDDILISEKTELFRKAVESHGHVMKNASKGLGIDRHLLGLRCMIKSPEEEKEAAKIFSDPIFTKSMYFKLSTSNMSPGTNFYGGFGAVVNEGYGVNYAIDKDSLKFSISSKLSCEETDSYNFRNTLLRTLKDLMMLFPKKSQVWGNGWKELHEKESKEKYMFEKMKQFSDSKNESIAFHSKKNKD